MSEQRPPQRPPQRAVNLVDLLQIGAVCGLSIGIGVFAGYLLDRAAGTAPLLTFIGLAAGILVAATGSWRVIRPFTAASRASREATTKKE